jgi:hypothetical protein
MSSRHPAWKGKLELNEANVTSNTIQSDLDHYQARANDTTIDPIERLFVTGFEQMLVDQARIVVTAEDLPRPLVGELRLFLSRCTGVSLDRFFLLYSGKRLNDLETLHAYEISKDAIIHASILASTPEIPIIVKNSWLESLPIECAS